MAITFKNFYNLYWKLFNIAGGGTEPDVTKVLDSIVKSDRSKLDQYFTNAIDQIAFDTEDWNRLRAFLIDLFTANRALITNTAVVSDPYNLSNDDLDELFRSFGFPESPRLKSFDNNPLESKVQLFLDLVNLYKIKGTPRSILEILQYYGIPELDIFEFWLQKEDPSTLVFKGDVITGTSINPSPLTLSYDLLTQGDPHWMMSHAKVLELDALNKINLPSKSPYFAVQPIVEIGVENAILVRLVQDQYDEWAASGDPKVLPPQNADITILGVTSSLLELYLLTLYSFQKDYQIGTNIADYSCYDGTSTNIADMVSEYEDIIASPILRPRFVSEITFESRTAYNSLVYPPFSGITYPTPPEIIPTISRWERYNELFTRKRETHFLYNKGDNAAGTVLNIINPNLIAELDALTADNTTVLQSLLKDLAVWVRNNLGFGFVNLGYIFFGLAQLFEDLKPVINFFKPYRARLVVLELLNFRNQMTESIPTNDYITDYQIDLITHDFMTGDSTPCCDGDMDTTSVTCIDTTAGTYYSRDTYDCGSYHDIGAVTDISTPVSINVDQYICDPMACPPGCPTDSTAPIVATYQGICDRFAGMPPSNLDGTSTTIIAPDCTSTIPLTCESAPIVHSEVILDTREQIVDLEIGSESYTVLFPIPPESPSYILNVNIFNEVDDSDASMYGIIITNKTAVGFTVLFSSPLDSVYYKLSWSVDTESTLAGNENLIENDDSYRINFGTVLFDNNYAIATSIINEDDTNPSIYNFIVTERDDDGFTLQFNSPIDSTNYSIDWNIYDSTSFIPNGLIQLSEGSEHYDVSLPLTQANDKYSLGLTMINTDDSSASIYSYITTKKTPTDFAIRFSSPIDSTNYYLTWAVTTKTQEEYQFRQEGGFRDFDMMGRFDCTHGFDSVEISVEVLSQTGVIMTEDYGWLLQEDDGALLLE